MNNKHIKLGFLDIPKEYPSFEEDRRKEVCDLIIDKLYRQVDKHLRPDINRIEFLDEIFESSLQVNEENELYEICTVIRDCRKRLNED